MGDVIQDVTLGLPWPWKLKRHYVRGDRFYFFSISPCTFALGGELLKDGFVLFLGPINIGWASISSFDRRVSEAVVGIRQPIDHTPGRIPEQDAATAGDRSFHAGADTTGGQHDHA